MVAPVLSQPSLPLGRRGRGSIGLSPAELACAKRRVVDEDLSILGLRFHEDPFVAKARFDSLREAFGDRFEAVELDPADARPTPGRAPHSVLTVNLNDADPEGPTRRAEARVIAFFKQMTA